MELLDSEMDENSKLIIQKIKSSEGYFTFIINYEYVIV